MTKPDNNRGIKRKVRNSYIISTVSIALVLFLLGSVGYLILGALKTTDAMRENMVISVTLNDGLSQERIDAIGDTLRAYDAVKEVAFLSKDDAASEFKEYEETDFEEFLSFNPLPDSWEVRLRAEHSDRESIAAFEASAAAIDGVREVVYQRAVAERIDTNITKFNLVLVLFGGALLIIALILLNNTIRLTIYSKRHLISTMKLVGASKWFIMRPLLGRSLLQGLWAWLIAAAMFLGLVAGLGEGLPEVTMLAENRPVYFVIGAMLLLGLVISATFTIFAVNKFVNMNSSKIHLY